MLILVVVLIVIVIVMFFAVGAVWVCGLWMLGVGIVGLLLLLADGFVIVDPILSSDAHILFSISTSSMSISNTSSTG